MFAARNYQKLLVRSPGGNRISVSLADTWLKRLSGLKSPGAIMGVDGILITPCSSVHTLGMQFNIDIYFLDRDFRVVRKYVSTKPWRCVFSPDSRHVLEVISERASSPLAQVGDKLSITNGPE